MNQLINHPQFGQVRVNIINGETWFVAKDVCDVLELSKNRDAVARLDVDERGSVLVDTPGGKQEMTTINESGLYALIIRSNKPIARKFRKWVTGEVLPAIRKYGTYSTDEKIMDRAFKKVEQRAVKNLLTEVSRSLSGTDKRLIAKQCLTDEYEVGQVLQGYKEDVHMMSLLYARATGNKKYRGEFYSLEGAENLLQHLKSHRP